jgi:hypothetical protein
MIKHTSKDYLSNPWYFKEEPFIEADKKWSGFVYNITDLTNGKKYIGKKFFWTKPKNPKTGKRELKESNWRIYYGSNVILKQFVKDKGFMNFRRDIVSIHTLLRDVNYMEMKLQYALGVLEQVGEDEEMIYMNGNIAGKHWSHLVRGIENRSFYGNSCFFSAHT